MKDIEDINAQNKNIDFLKCLLMTTFENEHHFQKTHTQLRKKYRICPSKPLLRKLYNELLQENEIEPNISFLKYSIKRKSRSQSGVSVITILTSPFPSYTNYKGEKVIQKFSCGEDCAYCPNEPEERIIMEVTNIQGNFITIITDDDIKLIRNINYISYDEKQFDVKNLSKLSENGFTIELSDSFPSSLKIEDIIIGVKIAQPRSYIHSEPGVLRGNRNNFIPEIQIYDRADALESCGNEVDKIEILVLGGTWDHYPLNYQNEFIRDIYHGINNLTTRCNEKLSLEKEIKLAETSEKRIIGLTIETRPDCINLKTIRKYRTFNITRLQIGVQHIDNDILKKIERGSTTNDTIKANHLWKHNGGKIDWHLMPDLPGSSVEKDLEMFRKIFSIKSFKEINKNHFVYDLEYPELQPDQLKIYPCEIVPWTKIKQWYEDGSYKPYSENEEELIKVVTYIKENVFPWIRINRIVRDIPSMNIIAGNKNVNLHQQIINSGVKSSCIRSREVKNNTKNIHLAELFIRQYNGVYSTEYFISYESPDQEILYGFLRLRINHTISDLIYPDFHDTSFIRELHVYGSIVKHDSKDNQVQHMGFGKKLLKKAEELSFKHGVDKIAIISGVGVRKYYEKNGYHLYNNYMIKKIEYKNFDLFNSNLLYIPIIVLSLSIIYDIYY